MQDRAMRDEGNSGSELNPGSEIKDEIGDGGRGEEE
jgi:hypothetical protein